MRLLFLIACACFLYGQNGYSQSNFLPSGSWLAQRSEKHVYLQKNAHTSVKPYRYSPENKLVPDSVLPLHYQLESGLLNAFFNENIISYSDEALNFELNPMFNLSGGYASGSGESDENIYQTGLGLRLKGSFRDKLGLGFTHFASNNVYPHYVDSFIRDNKVVPGMGYAHPTSLGFAAAYTDAYLAYSPDDVFTFEAGYGKNFFGDGYRSLILSDNSSPYPYFKITTDIWKFQYVNLYARLNDIRFSGGDPSEFIPKMGAFHYLSWNTTSWLNLSLFEGIIFQPSQGPFYRGYDVHYLNPLIFYRPVEYSIGSSDNAIMGLNIKLSPFKKHHLYGQFVIDEFLFNELKADFNHWRNPADTNIQWGWWANKYSFQAGYKGFDLFGVSNLNAQLEFNYARPFIYSHSSSFQNYGHYNQPLVHPLGASFTEFVGRASYFKNRWSVKFKSTYGKYGEDSLSSNYGGNIYLSNRIRTKEYENQTLQGIKNTYLNNEFTVSYLVNPNWGFRLEAGVRYRQWFNEKGSAGDLVYSWISIRSDLPVSYRDF